MKKTEASKNDARVNMFDLLDSEARVSAADHPTSRHQGPAKGLKAVYDACAGGRSCLEQSK